MIYRIQEGNYVMYTGLEGYNLINKALEDEYLNHILNSINWNLNKKYFRYEY